MNCHKLTIRSAPKEHDKRIKASHTINRCGWLFLLCEYYFLDNDVIFIRDKSIYTT